MKKMKRFLRVLTSCLLTTVPILGFAQTYLPQRNGQFYFPDEWLFSTGQPYHYKVAATNKGLALGSRVANDDEVIAIEKIKQQFSKLESKVFLLGDGDKIVHLELKPPAQVNSLLLSASMDKSVTAFSAGVAICDGKITLDAKVKDVLPELNGTDIGNSTFRDNLMMASGTTAAFDDSQSFNAQETSDLISGRKSLMNLIKERLAKGRFWTKPGERFDYKSQDPFLVGMMVAAAYGTGGKNFRNWQTEHFFSKVQTDGRRIQGVDQFGYAQSDGNTRMTINDWARFAVFIQQARKQQNCYGNFVREATRTQIKTDKRFAKMYDGYGYFVWTDNRDIPNSYTALGYGGQAIVWSTVNDKYFIVFSNSVNPSEIHSMARAWLDSK